MKGLYVPNAFTPNGDGKNDIFKALLFGTVKAFKFTVYNRFGQVIFSTSNPSDGWNGTFKGVLQEQDNYAWKCSYQLEGDAPQTKLGSFLLLR